jgi:hypothetical protein
MITSCKTMYRANKVNTPVFKKKGELQAELVTGSGGIEVQSAYSVTSNISLMLNGVYDNSKVRVIDTLSGVRDGNSEYNNIFGEGAIGYYKTFGRDTSKMVAMYFGAGIGETKGYSDRWDTDFLKYNSRYTRLFWQPTYGVLVKRNFEVAAAVRFSFLNYHSLTIKDDIETSYHASSYDFFIDPVLSIKGGYDQFKFVVQLGASLPIMKQEYYSSSPLLLSFGFHLNFTRYWEREDDYFED